MKYRLLFPLLTSLVLTMVTPSGVAFTQIDSKAEDFFPSSIGNVWRYEYGGNITLTGVLIRDSVVHGSRFLFFNYANVPSYEIDSQLNVYGSPTEGIYRALLYKLTANPNETWVVQDTNSQSPQTRVIARIDEAFMDFVLDTLTQVKRIGYYYQPVDDTTNFSAWRNDDYLASGIGLYLSIPDASQEPDAWLIGCIIDGKTHGVMTEVIDHYNPQLPVFHKLNPAFPNPFNPLTTIIYELPNASVVVLRVYNLLGEEVMTLVNETKPAGYHSVNFDGGNLPGGVYFYRLQAGNFSATKKLVLIK